MWRTLIEVGEKSHLHHYSRIDVNVSVNLKDKQEPFRLYVSRHRCFSYFFPFIIVRFSHWLTFRDQFSQRCLSIYGRRVVWSIIMKRFDLNGNQYWPSNVITILFEIIISLIRRLFHVYYLVIIDCLVFLRIADVSSSRRAVGIVICFARFDMYRNVRKGTWLMFMQIASGVLWAQRQTSFPLSCRISRRKHNRAWSRCQRSDSRRGELEGRQIACEEMRERDEQRWEKDVKSKMMNSRAAYDRQRFYMFILREWSTSVRKTTRQINKLWSIIQSFVEKLDCIGN